MREKELRDQIKQECLNYKTNFFGIGTLMRLEHNYYVAQRDNDYSFEGCPTEYDCLEYTSELCDTEKGGFNPTIEDCKRCWRYALNG